MPARGGGDDTVTDWNRSALNRLTNQQRVYCSTVRMACGLLPHAVRVSEVLEIDLNYSTAIFPLLLRLWSYLAEDLHLDE